MVEELKIKHQQYLSEWEKKKSEISNSNLYRMEKEILENEKYARESFEKSYIQTGNFDSGITYYWFDGYVNIATLRNKYPKINFEETLGYLKKPLIKFSFKPEYFF